MVSSRIIIETVPFQGAVFLILKPRILRMRLFMLEKFVAQMKNCLKFSLKAFSITSQTKFLKDC